MNPITMDGKEPIRVLHVLTHLNRNGLESRIMDIYRNIDRTKVQFDFMIHRKEKSDLGEEIEALGGRIYMMRRISPKHFFAYLKDLDDFFAEHKEYKIVHAHLNTLSTWVLLKAKKHGVPVRIAHSRNANMEKDFKAIPKLFSKQFINLVATDRFGCSKMAGEWLFGKKYANSDSFRVIPNAFQVDKFVWNEDVRQQKREELGLSDNQVAIINVARLSEQKNHMFLLDVFKEISKNNENAHLYLVGSGECEQKIKAAIKAHQLEKKVHMLGNRSDVAELYQASDLFLFPSKYEGFGTVLIEAQVTALPVLASDTIPHETKLCECVRFLPLEDSAANWAAAAEDLLKQANRMDQIALLQDAGYDIRTQYLWMERFYMDKHMEDKTQYKVMEKLEF